MNLSSARILIVDDDPLMLALVADTLRQIGIRNVQKCPDGKAGLTAVVKFQPHLICPTFIAPMSGLEFVKKLRAIPDRTRVPRSSS
jgi:DNA-binding response OmpR family regulator